LQCIASINKVKKLISFDEKWNHGFFIIFINNTWLILSIHKSFMMYWFLYHGLNTWKHHVINSISLECTCKNKEMGLEQSFFLSQRGH
jgi:hypothetical protein